MCYHCPAHCSKAFSTKPADFHIRNEHNPDQIYIEAGTESSLWMAVCGRVCMYVYLCRRISIHCLNFVPAVKTTCIEVYFNTKLQG